VGGYDVTEAGVFHTDAEGERRYICSRLDVLGLTRNGANEDWGRLLRVWDRDGEPHDWPMPMELLAGDGTELRVRLLALGLEAHPSRTARDHLMNYIQSARTAERARCVRRVGWCGDVFVLPDLTIGGGTGERILFQIPGEFTHHFEVSGTLEDWQEQIARYCAGNSRLMLAVSCAFTAPVLEPAGADGFGIHFKGPSSGGKTTALLVGGSVCGGGGRNGYVEGWRLTGNALEAVAEAHNHSLLCLDELAQLAPAEAGEIAYLLANGHGKQRMSRTATLRRGSHWRLLFLSSGETGLADHVATIGRRVRGGESVRFVEVPADAERGLGLFENVHGHTSGGAFADHLAAAARSYYGSPLRAFLELLVADLAANREAVFAFINEMRMEFHRRIAQEGAGGEVLRVAGVFALIAAAGELATWYRITGWEPYQAISAAEKCYRAWLGTRGGTGGSDVESGIRQVRAFLEAHGGSRFQAWEPGDRQGTVYNRAGFRRADETGELIEYAILEEAFRNEVCKGYDYQLIARALKTRGFLRTSERGRLTYQARVPEFGRTRFYLVRRELLGGT
jgi:uncharacterized protein (DUF927 family)